MKKLISFVLAALMLAAVLVPVSAEGTLELTADSHLTLGEIYVDGIDGTITVGKLKANFASAVDVAGKADDAAVATDDAVSCGGESLRALIYGDVNRDGKITVTDVTAMLKKLANWDVDVNSDAADVDASGKVNVSDVTKMLKYLAGWDDISLGNVRMVFENTKLNAPAEDKDITMFFANTMFKIGRSDTTSTGENAFRMRLARNEFESCQMYLASAADKEGLSLSLSDFEYEFGGATLKADLKKHFYVNLPLYPEMHPKTWEHDKFDFDCCTYDYYPEAEIELADTFELAADRSQGFLITVESKKDTPAGMYRATLDVKDASGSVIKTAYVYAQVWDFTLPDAPYSASAFNATGCTRRLGKMSHEECRVRYYDFILDYNLSDYILPYDILDPRADAYMSDPRVTAFSIGGWWDGDGAYGGTLYRSDDSIVQAYNKIMSNPDWAQKYYFYQTDEPGGDHLFDIKKRWEHVRDLLGTDDFRNMTPGGSGFATAEDQAKGFDALEFMKPYINVWCPDSWMFSENEYPFGRYSDMKNGKFIDRYQKLRERGDTMWWYVCCSPELPYANFFSYYQGVLIRMVLWQQYMVNSDGLLYYEMTHTWSNITRNKFEVIEGGDGTLLYSGDMFGYEAGPVASWRLTQIRDGFDDFDYMHMAEELYGRDEVMKQVNKVTRAMLDFTEDYRDMEAARVAVAKMLDGKYDK